jgi:hypothetical protein
MFAGRPLRQVAAELGVTPRTAARWRQRVMQLISERLPCAVGGRVEVMPFRRYNTPSMQFLVMVDDSGRATALVLPRNPLPADVAKTLRNHVAAGSSIVLSYRPSAFSRGAEAAGFRVEINEIGVARRYAHRLNRWLCGFYGTYDTSVYLAWFDALQAAEELERFVARWTVEAERQRPSGPATQRPGVPASRRPGVPASRRPGGPAARRPGTVRR